MMLPKAFQLTETARLADSRRGIVFEATELIPIVTISTVPSVTVLTIFVCCTF